MILLGLFILVTSISYLSYNYSLQFWSVLRKLGFDTKTSTPKKRSEPTYDGHTKYLLTKSDESIKMPNEKALQDAKFNSDRMAMPPPPPPHLSPIAQEKLPSENNTTTIGSGVISKNSSFVPPTQEVEVLIDAGENHSLHRGESRLPTTNSSQYMNLQAKKLNISNQHLSSDIALSPVVKLPRLVSPPTQSLAPGKLGAARKENKKVLLAPGYSPLDWARLMSSNAYISGLPPGSPYLKITPSVLKNYTGRKGKDAWTTLGGKVYNITTYLPFHPGGEPELLKCAGRDGTKLFTEVHPWVNWEGMLAKFLVGIAVEEGETYTKSTVNELD